MPSLFEIIPANASESSHEEYWLELETINQTCQRNKLSNGTKNLCNDENKCVDEKEELSRYDQLIWPFGLEGWIKSWYFVEVRK